jgi:hypothetical protein
MHKMFVIDKSKPLNIIRTNHSKKTAKLRGEISPKISFRPVGNIYSLFLTNRRAWKPLDYKFRHIGTYLCGCMVKHQCCQLFIRPDGLTWSDPTWPENKWVGYGFDFFDPNRIGLGLGQPDPTQLIIFFEIILWFSTN